MIYTGILPKISWDILRYHRIFSHETFQIVEKWLWPFTMRCDHLNINHFSTIWNISDCRKMDVTIHYEVWSAQYKPFFYNLKHFSMSVSTSQSWVLTNWELIFQHWDLSNWILFIILYIGSFCMQVKSFRFYFNRKLLTLNWNYNNQSVPLTPPC